MVEEQSFHSGVRYTLRNCLADTGASMTALDASAGFRHYLQPRVGYLLPTDYTAAVSSLLDTIQCANDF